MADESILAVRGLSSRRAGRLVLDGVDLDASAGAVTAVVGPSGSGKTSLLRCLVRLDEPSPGSVRLAGEDVASLDARDLRRRVALVPQAPVMLPGTVADNLRFGVEDEPVAGFGACLEQAGLSPAFLDREAGELSGGEVTRVALARALVREPVVLALDEPTAALDDAAGAAIERLLAALSAAGLAIVVVSHDLGSIGRVADRGIRLEAGRVVAHGGVAEIAGPLS